METYTSGTGRETKRIRVDLTPEEARALAAWADAEEERVERDERAGIDTGPWARGLRRIRTALRIEEGEQ